MSKLAPFATAEQQKKKKKLRSFINAVGGNVDIDFMDENYNTTHSVSYEGVSPARALGGITTFYDEGIKPKGNVSYSVVREEFVEGDEKSGVYEIDTDTMYGGEYGTLLKERYEIKDGKRNGAYSFVWDLGYRGEGQFKDGKAEGIFTEYFADGSKASETTYKNGLREGKAWRKMGGEIIETTYYGGKTESQWKDIDRMRSILRNNEEQGVSYSILKDEDSIPRYTKKTVEKGFGGIWIADKQEFAKFASAVKTTPHEEDGEGIAFTDNYFYAYYRNIDGQPVPYASVYMNRFESQDIVNVIREARKNGEKKGNREIIDLAYGLARNANRKNDADISDNKSASTTRGNGRVGSKLSRFGKYYYSPSLYVKTQRTDIKEYDDVETTNYSLNRTDIDYLDAVNRGDMATAQNDDIRYSLNRDEVTVATPEMVAEANPSGDATKSRIDAIRNEIEEKINRIATKKNVTFEEIEKLMLDENDDTEDIRYKLKMDCQSYQRSQISIPPPPLCSSPYLKGGGQNFDSHHNHFSHNRGFRTAAEGLSRPKRREAEASNRVASFGMIG